MSTPNPLLERLALLDSCAVSDALDRAGLHGVALGLDALSVGRRIVGRAVTVQLGPSDGAAGARHLCTAAVEAGGEEDIIVIAHEGRCDVAGWGGVLSFAASRRAIRGVVIDGACRDLDESRDLELPVYGRSAVPVTARGRIVEKAWDVPVFIAGISVKPGDLVIADGSGVAFIPHEMAEAVIATAEAIATRERQMVADLRRGHPVSQVMGHNYETMLNREGQE